jgi:hypothetical protein
VTNARGWSSAGLRAVGDDPHLWTAQEASAILGPPALTPTQVRALIRCAGLEPAGKRSGASQGAGRAARVYRAADLIKLYDAVYSVIPSS